MSDSEAIVDAHHHLWDLSRHSYHWLEGGGLPGHTATLGDYSAIRRNYLIEELVEDFSDGGVIKSVHVEADWSGLDPVDETRWLQQVADEHGYPNAIVVGTDLTSRRAQGELERHRQFSNVRGVRMLNMAGSLGDPRLKTTIPVIQRLGLSLEVTVGMERAVDIERLVGRFPDVAFVLGHAGMPKARTPEYFEMWRSGLQRVAKAPNLWVKVSGLGMTDHHWSAETLRPWVLAVLETFGPGRTMFGSNWPVDGLYSSYRDLLGSIQRVVADMSDDERSRFFRSSAEAFYSI